MKIWIFIGIYIALTSLGTYLAFDLCWSESWLKRFCFSISGDEFDPVNDCERSEAVKNFKYTNGLRTVFLCFLFFYVMTQFTNDQVNFESIFESAWYILGLPAAMIGVILWCFIIGPHNLREFSKKDLSYKEHFRPYICDLPNLVAPVVLFAPIMLSAVMLRGSFDYHLVVSTEHSINQTVEQLSLISIKEWDITLVNIMNFGYEVVNLAQKYLGIGLIAFIYAYVEEKTYLRKTIIPSSPDKIKLIAWGVLILGLYGLLFLPSRYIWIYTSYQKQIIDTIAHKGISADMVSSLKDLLIDLDSIDIKWLTQKIIFAHGNTIVYIVTGSVFILRNLLFSSTKEAVKFVFPKFIYTGLKDILIRIMF